MTRGCCLGCIGMLLILALVIGGGFFFADRAFNLFNPAGRVDLAAAYGVDHAVVARLDLSSEYLQDLTGRAMNSQPWIIKLFWPHEVLLVLDANSELNVRDLTLAISTRRFGGFLSTWIPLGDDVDVGGGYIVRDIGLNSDGVLRVTASGDFDEDTQTVLAEWTDSVEPYTLSREHLFELIVNNNEGAGYATLRTWFEVDEETWPLDERALSPAEVDELCRRVGALRMTADVVDEETMEIVIETRSSDRDKAEAIYPLLNALLASFKVTMEENKAEFTGEFSLDGDEIRGEFLLRDFDHSMVEASQDVLEEIEQP